MNSLVWPDVFINFCGWQDGGGEKDADEKKDEEEEKGDEDAEKDDAVEMEDFEGDMENVEDETHSSDEETGVCACVHVCLYVL